MTINNRMLSVFFSFIGMFVLVVHSAALATPADCHPARSDRSSLTITYYDVVEGQPKKGVVVTGPSKDGIKAVTSRGEGFPQSATSYAWEILETRRDIEEIKFHSQTTYENQPPAGWPAVGMVFDTDVITTGSNANAAGSNTFSSRRHSHYAVTGLDAVSIAGCSYPVLVIHLATTPANGEGGMVLESEIKYSLQLHTSLESSAKITIGNLRKESSTRAVSITVDELPGPPN